MDSIIEGGCEVKEPITVQFEPRTLYSAIAYTDAGMVFFGVYSDRDLITKAVKDRVKSQLPNFWTAPRVNKEGREELEIRDNQGFPRGVIVIYEAKINEPLTWEI